MIELLTHDQINERLRDLSEWQVSGQALVRATQAPDFLTGIRIVDAVGEIAEEMDHHPDIDIRWTTVSFSLSTHSKGGITENDVTLARRIDDVITQHQT